MSADAVAFVQGELAALANPEYASNMAAYMKTDMAFYGVKSPERREVAQNLWSRYPSSNAAEMWAMVDTLWGLPHREEKYLAIAYARRFVQLLGPDDLPSVRRLIVEGSWWDFVDELAIQVVGPVLRAAPRAVWPVMEQWNEDPDMWLRRSSLICQVGSKAKTDEAHLFTFCLARAHEKEFFIRKAIGWALRQYSRIEPEAVRRFLAEHHERLSGLSVREASKHLTRLTGAP